MHSYEIMAVKTCFQEFLTLCRKNWHIKNKNNSFLIIREKIEKVKEFSNSLSMTHRAGT